MTLRTPIIALGISALLLSPLSTPPLQAQTENTYQPVQEYNEYMRLGYAAQQDGDYVEAANFFRAALYAVPNDQEATTAYWNARAALQPETELSDRAAQYEANMDAGYDATDTGDYEAALSYFQAALQLRPRDYYAAQAIRNVYTYLNRGVGADSPTDVSPTYNVYVGEAPYDRYMRLGYDATQRGSYAQALRFFESALAERPNDVYAVQAIRNVQAYLAP